MFILLLSIYLGLGLIVAFWTMFSDTGRSRLTGIRIVGDLASLGSISFLIYLLLWPIWLLCLLAFQASKEEVAEKIEMKAAEPGATDNPDDA